MNMKTLATAVWLCAISTAAINAASPFDAIVAQDGSGDYTTVSEAIENAPEGRTEPWRVLVKRGDYNELIDIPETKPHIHLIGQDREKTIIHHRINQGGPAQEGTRFDKTVYWDCSVHNPEAPVHGRGPAATMIRAPYFYAEGISFVNDWGAESLSGPQALALHSNADACAFNDCRFTSFQDTWRTPNDDTNRNYANGCLIEGAVDYMYGGGDVWVQNSTFRNLRGGSVIVAPSHMPDTKWGYVINNCLIDGTPESADGRQKLGRPWKNAPKTVYLNTTLLIPVATEGWGDMGTIPAIFAEYNTRLQDGTPVDLTGRKKAYHVRGRNNAPDRDGECPATITPEEASAYTYEAVIRPDAKWDPRAMHAPLPAPRNVKTENGTLSWSPVEGAAGYLVYDGDDIIAVTDATSVPVGKVKTALKLRAVNKYGSKGLLTSN